MAAFTKSPRRILGDRNVNTPCSTSPSKFASNKSPGKKPALYFGAKDVVREAALTKVLLSPRMGAKIHSPSSGTKRRAACMEDAREESPRKQVIIGLADHESEDDVVKGTSTKLRVVETSTPRSVIDIGLLEKTESTLQVLRCSNSSDQSFDLTEDSLVGCSQNSFENSQDTAVTVPDDPTPAAIFPPVAQTQTLSLPAIPTEELRLNAATLKAKLQLAMYKVNTEQEKSSFEQLEVIKPPTTPTRQRTPLPSRRPNKTPSPPEQHHQRDISRTSNNIVEYDVIYSPQGPVLEVTTPRRNRPNSDIALPRPDDNSGTSKGRVQIQQEGLISDRSTSSLSNIEAQSQVSQKSPTRAQNISSIEVNDQAAVGLPTLKRKASGDCLEDSSDNFSFETGGHLHPPLHKHTRTIQDKNDSGETQ